MEVSFVTSAPDPKQRPERVLPEFAFIGRSNCGKSSLINHVLGRRDLARTGGKPGRTRLMNYFLVDDRFYVVDLPGYGFAKVSKTQRAAWHQLFRRYLACQDRPLAVFQLLDARHKPSAGDREVAGWIADSGHPCALAITKIDKVGTNSRPARYHEIITTLGADPDTPFFPTSARVGTGRLEMLAWVEALLAANADPEETGGI
ncbi:MAG: YihA family ribosome biogenesis GTP-binding protein [bacterium]|nr:YihA family ribosome biogenesis GTP-binding protein [bacterium]